MTAATSRRWLGVAVCGWWLVAWPGPLIAAVVVRGPYLQMGTSTSVVARWRTNQPTNSAAIWGESLDDMTQAVWQAGQRTEHVLTLGDLAPDTRYYYAIGTIDGTVLAGGDSNHYFRTSPPPGTSKRTHIWVLGDSGTANQNARNVRDAFYTWNGTNELSFWMMLGDNAYNSGLDPEYQTAIFNMYTQTLPHAVLWLTLGNHDGISAQSATQTGPYYNNFTLPRLGEAGGMPSGTEAYYSFDYANMHFVCLESYETDRSTNGTMLTWLQADLASTTQAWVIAYWHHPPYTKGTHDSDEEIELIEMRENALPILEAGGVDLVLCGHSHVYERSHLLHGHYGYSTELLPEHVINAGDGRLGSDGAYDTTSGTGTVYVVAGSSGQVGIGPLNHPIMYLSMAELGSVVLDVDGNRLDATFIGCDTGSSTPQVVDWFTIVKDMQQYTLVTAAEGPGSVTTGGVFLAQTMLTITSAPNAYSRFNQWGGDLTGTDNPASLTMDSDKTVTAFFSALTSTNGMPWWWLAGYGLETNDAAADADQDADGHAAWAEYVTGTDPTNGASRLQILELYASDPPTNLAVVWPSVSNRIYTVDWAPDLNLEFAVAAGASNLVATPPTNRWEPTLDAAATSGYYRITAEISE